MPFCTQCGSQVGDNDQFCGSCGTRQGTGSSPGGTSSASFAGAATSSTDYLSSISSRNACTVCYIPFVGWIGSIIVLAADRFREERGVRFHAFQGLYLFVLYLFVNWVFEPIAERVQGARMLAQLPFLVILGTWIFMMVKTSQGQDIRLPILGELADRSVSEQK